MARFEILDLRQLIRHDRVRDHRPPQCQGWDQSCVLLLHTEQFVSRVTALIRNRVRQYIDTAGQRVIHAHAVLRMSKDGLALSVGHIDCRFDDSGINIHYGFGAHV